MTILIFLDPGAPASVRERVIAHAGRRGVSTKTVTFDGHTCIGVFGDAEGMRVELEAIEGVRGMTSVNTQYVFSSVTAHAATRVSIGSVSIGAEDVVVAAGPCAVESLEQTVSAAQAVARSGAHLLRGGAYKPSTSPHHFRGLGVEGLHILAEARRATGLPVLTEVMSPRDVDLVSDFADCLQVGARNMQNYPLLEELGGVRKPVLLKRGLSATIEEYLLAADYVLERGNDQVVLCERGVRGFDPATRNIFDVAAIPLLHELTHLPVLADPSHGTGRAELVQPVALAALAAGADGLLIEVHPNPSAALKDGYQSLDPAAFDEFMRRAALLLSTQSRPLRGIARSSGSQSMRSATAAPFVVEARA